MINFTVGPVQTSDVVSKIGAEQVPYFRTDEFSKIMLENERLMLKFSHAPQGAKTVFLTGSGSAAMEAAIINTLTSDDNALVVNGGSFGHRFVELLKIHKIPFTEIKLSTGKKLTADVLNQYNGQNYTAFLVNLHETSTGVLYDMELISNFCKQNNLFLIVDSISSFLADAFNMDELNVDVMLTGSQKALACPPGISILVLSKLAQEKIKKSATSCMYLDLKSALKNMERGQTPFTPAVGILRQIHARLCEIDSNGGVDAEIKRTAQLANYFRSKIANLPFEIISESMSNAVTPLHPLNASAHEIFITLKDEYGIWVCPNGGDLKDSVFRVGHIGNLTKKDYDILISAFEDLQRRKLI